MKERPDIGVYVKDLSTVTVSSADDMEKLMAVGYKNRSVGATAMNERSSRWKIILNLIIRQLTLNPHFSGRMQSSQ